MVAMEGKVAVVTGVTEGIGKAVAKGLAREGASVVLGYRSEEKAGAAPVARSRPDTPSKGSSLAEDEGLPEALARERGSVQSSAYGFS